MPLRSIMLVAALAAATPALAEEGRALCPDRPGLGTPACTVDVGAVVLEVGVADWTLDDNADSRTDSWAFGDTLLRAGLTPSLEVQVGWTMLGHVRERDRATGDRTGRTRTGDVTLALRQNLRSPDGSGFSLAIMPYATLPLGGDGVGAGDWGAGLIVPVSFELGALSLGLSPHVDAAVDADGDGRHLAYGSVAGLGFDLSDDVSAAVELSLTRDRDPAGHATAALAGVSLGWQPGADSQWDIGVNAGLNRASPDVQLYAGYVRRF
ncbi:transporter [Sphingopyxis panaciterrulae]|uniref:MetA-pathway of phenol degradation n=1 Tax=Sphingopyxis panaciterrulae TaxID=462372 RepID=A0A7W9B5B1_9SPHN|nr:transporter [Sphingopyxis panaciterrulae]MBB5706526.1 hypothetical protein [Sphingopyxis panaciterrulae]